MKGERVQGPPPPDAGIAADWPRSLWRKIVRLLIAKLMGLVLLWALFFSPSHRVEVTPAGADRLLAIRSVPPNPAMRGPPMSKPKTREGEGEKP